MKAGKCRQFLIDIRTRMTRYLNATLANGIETKVLSVPDLNSTCNILIAMMNGLMRQRLAGLADNAVAKKDVSHFCCQALGMAMIHPQKESA